MVKEIEVTEDAKSLIPGVVANKKSKSAVNEDSNTKIKDIIKQQKSRKLEKPNQATITSIKSENTHELTKQQIKAKGKIKKKQQASETNHSTLYDYP